MLRGSRGFNSENVQIGEYASATCDISVFSLKCLVMELNLHIITILLIFDVISTSTDDMTIDFLYT